jgi:hypothetical protein
MNASVLLPTFKTFFSTSSPFGCEGIPAGVHNNWGVFKFCRFFFFQYCSGLHKKFLINDNLLHPNKNSPNFSSPILNSLPQFSQLTEVQRLSGSSGITTYVGASSKTDSSIVILLLLFLIN